MGNRIVVLRLDGIRPLLTHNPAAMIAAGAKGEKLGRKHIPTPEEEAKAGIYLNEAGNFSVPSAGIRNGIMKAASKTRLKFGKVYAQTIISAALFPMEEFSAILDPETMEPVKEYAIDIRSVVIKGCGRVTRARPRFNKWCVRSPFELDETQARGLAEGIEEVGNSAGRIIGLGDYRIECKGTFGQYTLKVEK